MIVRKLSVVVVLLVLVQSAFAQKRPKDKLLDRKVFVITMEEVSDKKKKEEPFEEELSFRTNKMSTVQMRSADRGGFQMGEYAISKVEKLMEDAVYHFQAINRNQKGMSLKWEGKVLVDQIEGKATVSKKGKIKEEYTFSGALKEK
ncbi:MAG: hypothetical protein K9G41_00835 [Flavobacteriales bacterium]|nr:hypothetical protein [Flavobacteriales bacterium]